jgi:hypothetical protein
MVKQIPNSVEPGSARWKVPKLCSGRQMAPKRRGGISRRAKVQDGLCLVGGYRDRVVEQVVKGVHGISGALISLLACWVRLTDKYLIKHE